MGKIVILQSPQGIREMPAGQPFQFLPGERVVGTKADDSDIKLHEELGKRGVLLGDFVEAAIKKMPEKIRPSHCTACERRKQGLNWFHQRVKEVGVVKAVSEVIDAGTT